MAKEKEKVKVWLVCSGDYEDTRVEKVFTTKELAEDYIEQLRFYDRGMYEPTYCIERELLTERVQPITETVLELRCTLNIKTKEMVIHYIMPSYLSMEEIEDCCYKIDDYTFVTDEYLFAGEKDITINRECKILKDEKYIPFLKRVIGETIDLLINKMDIADCTLDAEFEKELEED